MRAGIIGARIECAADEPASFSLLALLAFADAEQMQRVELGGVIEQDLPVERLGAGEVAAILSGDGVIQGRVGIGFQSTVYLCLPVLPDAG